MVLHSDTCVLIPVYNEEKVIKDVITNVQKYFSNIICIDDGSTDNSVKRIQATNVKLISYPRNKGQGGALRVGLNNAIEDNRFNYFITLDADGQHNPRDASKMLEILKNRNVDIALGSRFLGYTENMPISKRILLKIAIKFTNKLTGIDLTDTHNGLRVFNRRFAEKLEIRCNGMAHATEFIYRIKEWRFSYCEVPVTIIYSDYSRSKGQSIFNSFLILKELWSVRS
ncbi:MAG: glycosyltransferase [Candidatus Saccharimonadales bacterium]